VSSPLRHPKALPPGLPPLPREGAPPAGEPPPRHKRRYRECRSALTLAGIVLVILWLPWILEQLGTAVPFFSASGDNAALCVLLAQAVICILCWPVYRAAVNSLREGSWTICATALLATMVTLLDEMTMLLLPERTDAAPLGGLAAALSVCALWGLTGWHRGMAETFRIAAMGEPARVVDCGGQGIARGRGSGAGFYTRAAMEDTSSQWQRLLLPVLAAASLVFAALSSAGQGRGQDFLWCWSVILCTSSSLVFPLSFSVPFGRTASHLARSGAAAAGLYGAAAFASDRRLTVTDTDLFPPGAARLAGVKLYGEEQNRALSYAASLAIQGGGLPARLFGDAIRRSRVSLQSLEHFHIHEDGGLGGMIHGETVLVGSPSFMRRQAVRLPHALASKTAVCLAVDGELAAVFTIKYAAAEPVEYALRILRHSGFRLILATRDSNITPKFLKARFGWSGGAEPLEIGERLIVVPDWETADIRDRVELRLNPGLAFGTGSHATTRLCLTALEKHVEKGMRVLDLGCGSGILSIASLLLGAESAFACDIDEKAVDIAYENAALNGVGRDRYTVRAGDVLSDKGLRREMGDGYDIVAANIVSDVIIALAPEVSRWMKPEGWFLCSGIIDDRAAEVRQVLEENGFAVAEEGQSEGWFGFLCRRGG